MGTDVGTSCKHPLFVLAVTVAGVAPSALAGAVPSGLPLVPPAFAFAGGGGGVDVSMSSPTSLDVERKMQVLRAIKLRNIQMLKRMCVHESNEIRETWIREHS